MTTDHSPEASSALPPLLPRRLLFGNPERIAPRLSPDGKCLAYLAPRDGVLNVYVRTVGQSDDRPLTQETKRPVRALQWSENGQYILYPQDFEGDENFHVFRTDADTGVTNDLTPFPGVRAQIVATDPAFPDVMLLSTNHRDPQAFDVYRCDLATGDLTLIAQNPGNIVGWEADGNLAIRAAIATRPDGGSDLLVRDTPDNEWRPFLSVPFGESVSPLAFTGDNAGLFLLTDKDVNTARLYQADLATGNKELLHAREDTDLARVLLHPTERTLQAVGYNRARLEWVPLNAGVVDDFAVLAALDTGDWAIAPRDTADTTWLVGYSHDDAPVRYYVYDRATKKAAFLFTDRPELDGKTLAPMTPVEIPARDGLILPCYLTVPVGVTGKVPLIVDVHGGAVGAGRLGLEPRSAMAGKSGLCRPPSQLSRLDGFWKGAPQCRKPRMGRQNARGFVGCRGLGG